MKASEMSPKTSDNCLSLRTTAFNRPSPNALSDEQLSWEQFMDANHLFCRWFIPAGWPEGHAKVLSSFCSFLMYV
jgi:hypothetical protein